MNYGQKPPGYGAPPPPWSQPTPPNAGPQWGGQPYGAPPAQFAANPYAAPYVPPSAPAPLSSYGDKAGEHLTMKRGRYNATAYVFLAFLMQIGAVTALLAVPAMIIAAAANFNDDATGTVTLAAAGTGFVGGIVLAWFMFRDRWKCIEAFSSRFCSGLVNLSMLYVPVVALVYANVRGVQKLSGR